MLWAKFSEGPEGTDRVVLRNPADSEIPGEWFPIGSKGCPEMEFQKSSRIQGLGYMGNRIRKTQIMTQDFFFFKS